MVHGVDRDLHIVADDARATNHTNGIALLDPLIEAFRQQRRLSAIGTLNEALHELPPQTTKRIITERTFSRSQGQNQTSVRSQTTSALALGADIDSKGDLLPAG